MVDQVPGATQPERTARLLLYAGLGLVVLGLVVVYLGYNGTAQHTNLVQQFPFLVSGGIAGLALVVVGAAVLVGSLIINAQTAVRAELSDLRDELAEFAEAFSRSRFESASPEHSSNGYVMVSRGGSSFHATSCRLVEAKDDMRPVPKPEAERLGLLACRICKP